MVQVDAPLGIPAEPIIAPAYDELGQSASTIRAFRRRRAWARTSTSTAVGSTGPTSSIPRPARQPRAQQFRHAQRGHRDRPVSVAVFDCNSRTATGPASIRDGFGQPIHADRSRSEQSQQHDHAAVDAELLVQLQRDQPDRPVYGRGRRRTPGTYTIRSTTTRHWHASQRWWRGRSGRQSPRAKQHRHDDVHDHRRRRRPSPWQNPHQLAGRERRRAVSPIDALIDINEINSGHSGPLPFGPRHCRTTTSTATAS